MRAHQIMTRDVATIGEAASISEAATMMLDRHISGLPVVDAAGRLVGVVSESDFMRRAETGTQRRRNRWLRFFAGPGVAADEYVRAHGRKVSEIMTPDPVTVSEDASLEDLVGLMEKNSIKRLPVMHAGRMVGIVTRANLLRTVAGLARDIPDPTADDERLRKRIVEAISNKDWSPLDLQVAVRDGVVHLHGLIESEAARKAAIVATENVAGVKEIRDHLFWYGLYSGGFFSPQ
jgi:CBS-domain-containing membrane protein